MEEIEDVSLFDDLDANKCLDPLMLSEAKERREDKYKCNNTGASRFSTCSPEIETGCICVD